VFQCDLVVKLRGTLVHREKGKFDYIHKLYHFYVCCIYYIILIYNIINILDSFMYVVLIILIYNIINILDSKWRAFFYMIFSIFVWMNCFNILGKSIIFLFFGTKILSQVIKQRRPLSSSTVEGVWALSSPSSSEPKYFLKS